MGATDAGHRLGERAGSGRVRERLEREFDLSLIATAPSVAHRAFPTNGSQVDVDNPSELPEPKLDD